MIFFLKRQTDGNCSKYLESGRVWSYLQSRTTSFTETQKDKCILSKKIQNLIQNYGYQYLNISSPSSENHLWTLVRILRSWCRTNFWIVEQSWLVFLRSRDYMLWECYEIMGCTGSCRSSFTLGSFSQQCLSKRRKKLLIAACDIRGVCLGGLISSIISFHFHQPFFINAVKC